MDVMSQVTGQSSDVNSSVAQGLKSLKIKSQLVKFLEKGNIYIKFK